MSNDFQLLAMVHRNVGYRPGAGLVMTAMANWPLVLRCLKNITERKMAESQQLEQAARTSAILQHIRDAIVALSDNGLV